MNLDVTLCYVASVLAARQRTPRPRAFSERMTVEVREVGLPDLPVAMRWDVASGAGGARSAREVRWDGEALWQRLGEGGRAGPQDVAWLLARVDHRDPVVVGGAQDPLSLRTQYIDHGTRAPFMAADPTVVRVSHTYLPERRAEVEAAAASLLLVDGALYERAVEPVLVVRRGGLVGKSWVRVVQMGDVLENGNDLWRADETAHMSATQDLEDGWERDAIEVLLPEAVRAPLPESALLRAGKATLDDMAKAVLERDAGFFSAYAAVRDTRAVLSAGLARGDGRGTEAFVAALVAARDVLPSLRPRNDPDYAILSERLVDAALDRRDALAFADGFAP